jgi:hypothetical protein
VNLSVCMFNFALHYLFNIQHPLQAHLMKPSKVPFKKVRTSINLTLHTGA